MLSWYKEDRVISTFLRILTTLFFLTSSFELACHAQLSSYTDDPNKSAVRIFLDLPYGPHNKNGGNLLDLYLPLHVKGRCPLVVWVHGGGWRIGNKDVAPSCFLTQEGFAVASINYRLSSEAKFPAQIEDCSAALQWLSDNASEYNIDPDRIGLWGASAGGHLVALIGTARDAKGPAWAAALGRSAKNVKCVCDWNGPSDLLTTISKDKNSSLAGMESELLPIKSREAWAIEASPTTYVAPTDVEFFIAHGDKDSIVPLEQSKKFSEMLKSNGVHCIMNVVPNADHNIGSAEILAQVVQFFQRTLQSKDHIVER